MHNINNRYNLYAVIYYLGTKITQNIKEFKYIIKNRDLKNDLPNIVSVYMNSIILNLSKLISATRSDKTGLKQLKNIAPKEIKKRIEKFEKSYNDIFKKIVSNRNRIIAHIDISAKNAYYNMGLSAKEISKIITDYKNSYYYDKLVDDENDKFINNIRKKEAQKKDNERYSFGDFKSDLSKFKNIIEEIILINNSINKYYYEKQRK